MGAKRRLTIDEGVERMNIRFPRQLAEDLKRLVPPRKRSQTIVAATAEMVARLKQQAALKAGAGAWSDQRHPELKTQDDINRYLADLRSSTNKRIRQ